MNPIQKFDSIVGHVIEFDKSFKKLLKQKEFVIATSALMTAHAAVQKLFNDLQEQEYSAKFETNKIRKGKKKC